MSLRFLLFLATIIFMFLEPYQVGILGNAADFYDDNPSTSSMEANMDRRQMMIAFDMRYARGTN